MAGCLLYLELGFKRLRGKTIDESSLQSTGKNTCHVDYKASTALKEPNDFEDALDALAEKLNVSSCTHAVVLIRDHDVAFRNTSLPFSGHKKIQQVLPLELSTSLPWPDIPCLTDFILQDISFTEGQRLILSASIPESLIQDITLALRNRGITTRIIAPRGYAAAVSLLSDHKKIQDSVFIHFSSDCIAIIMIINRKPVMVRSLSFPNISVAQLSRAVLQTCRGLNQLSCLDPEFTIILASENDEERQISLFIHEFKEHLTHPPQHEAHRIKDIRIYKESFFLPRDHGPVPLINFCKGEYGPGGLIRKFLGELVIAAVIGGLAVMVFFMGIYRDVGRLEKKVALQRSKAVALYTETFPDKVLNPALPPLLLMQSHVKAVEKNNRGNSDLKLEAPPKATTLDVLYALSVSIPETLNADLTRLLYGQNRLTITGSTSNFNAVDKLKTAIEKAPIFSRVTIITAEAEKTSARILFKFRVDME